MNYYYYYDCMIGRICIKDNGKAITEISFENKKETKSNSNPDIEQETILIKEAYRQLNQYFNKARNTFDVPLSLKGTEFQQKVWKALATIPFGETRTYKDMAVLVGNEKACRAVGGANNKNPIPIIIPCHRVIGTDGKMVGYAGGLDIKMKLLELEGYRF